ncbi:hypothetical protein NKDENANG_03712 [Candidatus Entotheonellaceae bacterium PAL068K]
MISFVIRGVIVVLALWVLWRLYTALFPARRLPPAGPEDEWEEVLEAIDELPETTDSHPRAPGRRQPVENQPHQYDGAMSQASIESVIVHQAEIALSLMRQSDETERLAAYHEITTYDKLCNIAECAINERTRRKIDDIRRQAWKIICSSDNN